ncbi:outer membrane lipoprotein SlyB [Variibacter gotjawalensis]|nr:hypothetical protein [Variibacter gotjawalensis]NIK49309.1 outer membrane lipoprotein SlyB [Variibacter gotjawalensis]
MASIVAMSMVAAVPAANAQSERTLTGAAIGAGSGALIAGPVGAVAGGVIGATVGGPRLSSGGRRCWRNANGRRVCRRR